METDDAPSPLADMLERAAALDVTAAAPLLREIVAAAVSGARASAAAAADEATAGAADAADGDARTKETAVSKLAEALAMLGRA